MASPLESIGNKVNSDKATEMPSKVWPSIAIALGIILVLAGIALAVQGNMHFALSHKLQWLQNAINTLSSTRQAWALWTTAGGSVLVGLALISVGSVRIHRMPSTSKNENEEPQGSQPLPEPEDDPDQIPPPPQPSKPQKNEASPPPVPEALDKDQMDFIKNLGKHFPHYVDASSPQKTLASTIKQPKTYKVSNIAEGVRIIVNTPSGNKRSTDVIEDDKKKEILALLAHHGYTPAK